MGRRTAWVATAAALVLLAGCSGGGSGSTDATSDSPTGSSPSSDTSGGDAGAVQRYVAMGDSYTAAPGVPQQDPSDPCYRSSRSYPELVHEALRPSSYADVSCSGAQTSDLTGSQTTGSGAVPPQLEAVTADTDLVTIGIGGNDFDLFSTLVGRCTILRYDDPTGSPCADALATKGGGNTLLDELPTIAERIIAVVKTVEQQAPQARIVLVGYPQILPATGTCPSRLPLATGDYEFARQVNEGLDRVVSEAAALTGAGFADIWTASAGHDICAAQPWINGRQSTDRAASFHPYAVEQAAVARLVVAGLQG